jgi:hypothetical protein
MIILDWIGVNRERGGKRRGELVKRRWCLSGVTPSI